MGFTKENTSTTLAELTAMRDAFRVDASWVSPRMVVGRDVLKSMNQIVRSNRTRKNKALVRHIVHGQKQQAIQLFDSMRDVEKMMVSPAITAAIDSYRLAVAIQPTV